LTLEQSGKWPDELMSFTHMKRLMVIRIHELLSPLGIPSHVTANNMLDIFLDGLVFRVSVAQPRELRLLQKTAMISSALPVLRMPGSKSKASVASSTDTPLVDTPASLAWTRLNRSMPAVCGMLAAVARSEAHVFPVACRLAKRWLSAHGFPVVLCPFEAELDGVRDLNGDVAVQSKRDGNGLVTHRHQASTNSPNPADCAYRLTEIAVELLVLYAAGFSTPVAQRSEISDGMSNWESVRVASGSPVAAFLRFLRLLATHDWEQRPLLIDLNEGFADVQKRRAALTCFETGRERLPAMVLCTPLDPSGSEWTTLGPTRAGLCVLQQLAAHSRALLRAMLVAGAKFRELKNVFRPTLRNMDLLMTLKPEIIEVHGAESIDYDAGQTGYAGGFQTTTTKPIFSGQEAEDALPTEIPPPGARFWPSSYCYDPLQWVARLVQVHLSRYFEVFWDRHGGNWIGLRRRPTVIDSEHEGAKRIFARDVLDGLVVHKPSADGSQMVVTHKLPRLVRLLPDWVSGLVERVEDLSATTSPENNQKNKVKKKRMVELQRGT
uniref:Nucleolar protein 6 n=1 Tax=Echinostoma caproni TaxID=27848 RepID=A0A183B7Z7_9TREM